MLVGASLGFKHPASQPMAPTSDIIRKDGDGESVAEITHTC